MLIWRRARQAWESRHLGPALAQLPSAPDHGGSHKRSHSLLANTGAGCEPRKSGSWLHRPAKIRNHIALHVWRVAREPSSNIQVRMGGRNGVETMFCIQGSAPGILGSQYREDKLFLLNCPQTHPPPHISHWAEST